MKPGNRAALPNPVPSNSDAQGSEAVSAAERAISADCGAVAEHRRILCAGVGAGAGTGACAAGGAGLAAQRRGVRDRWRDGRCTSIGTCFWKFPEFEKRVRLTSICR